MSEVYANILNALTSGLYIQVNIALREYLQNAYDAIKSAKLQGISEPDDHYHVEVKLTKDNRTITVSDNGIGMDKAIIEEYTSIGGGTKNSPDYAGYKGIGKLSGLRFFQIFIVRTKQAGTQDGYELSWRSGDMMRTLLGGPEQMKKIPYSTFIRDYYEIKRIHYPDIGLHFTQIQLTDVIEEFRDQIDENRIGKFIKTNCPVPFLESSFEHANKINDFLGSSFEPVTTYINDRVVYRPHQDSFRLASPKFEEIRYKDHLRAKAWFSWEAKSAELIGEENIRGINFRCKGLCVGDRNLFANNCMPEGRSALADWFTGEICVLDEDIKPNTARDGFEKSEATRNFYAELKKHVGKKLSSLADARSEIHAAEQHASKVESLVAEQKPSASRELEKLAERLKNLKRKQDNNEFNLDFSVINKIEDLLKGQTKKDVEQATTSEQNIKQAIENNDTGKLINILLDLKEKEVQSPSNNVRKEISSLIGRTVKQVAEEKISYLAKDKPCSEEETIIKILVMYLDHKNIAYEREEVERFVRQALLKDRK